MKKLLLLICFLAFSGTAIYAQAGKKPFIVQEPQAQKADAKKRGSVIKSDVPTTDSITAEAKTRGSSCKCYCTTTFDNYTAYWIKIYIQGEFQGYLQPYDTIVIDTVWDSQTTYYCETAGGTLFWDGISDCAGTNYIKLRE